MKKIISITLALILILALAMPAMAATNTLVVDSKRTGNVTDAGLTYTFSGSTGMYTLTASTPDELPIKIDVTKDSNSTCCGTSLEPAWNAYTMDMVFFVQAGESYTVEIAKDYDEDGKIPQGNASISLLLTKMDASALPTGKTKVERADAYYLFTPTATGYYNFASDAPHYMDPYAHLYDDLILGQENDDNGRKGELNFDLTVYLQKGVTYALNFSTYVWDEEKEFTPYNVTVSYNKNIPAEEIVLFYGEPTTSFLMARGEEIYLFVNVVPTGAIPTTKLTVSVADESIVNAVLDESDNTLCVTALKNGKTTITVTDQNGMTATTKVTVRAPGVVRILNVITYILSAIRNIFSGILGGSDM